MGSLEVQLYTVIFRKGELEKQVYSGNYRRAVSSGNFEIRVYIRKFTNNGGQCMNGQGAMQRRHLILIGLPWPSLSSLMGSPGRKPASNQQRGDVHYPL